MFKAGFNSGVYAWWQTGSFWFVWLILLLPAYAAAFGTWMLGSLLPGFHEPVDITLTAIFFVTLLLLMAIAVYTGWHFVHKSRHYTRLRGWLLAGVLVIPLVSASGAVFAYVQLTGIEVALIK